MSFHKEDYEKGAINENDFLPVIQQHFNDLTIERTKERFNPFDFTNNSNLLIELKCRSNCFNKYPDTIIGTNKIIKARELTKENPFLRVWFFFKFSDCIAKWEYKEDNEKDLISKIAGRNDRRDHKGKIMNEFKQYYAIPIDKLTVVKDILFYD